MGVEASNCSDAPRSMSVPGMDWMALSDSPSHKEAVAVAEDALSVYPNPTYGRLNLELTSDYRGVVDAIVSDVNGRRLITRQFTKEEQWLGGAIDVSSLPPGVYLLRLSEGAGQKVLQFISR